MVTNRSPKALLSLIANYRTVENSAANIALFESIFYNTKDRLYSFTWNILRNTTSTQDCLQQCYLKLWEVFDKIDTQKDVMPLLYTYARNLVTDHLRKYEREQLVESHFHLEEKMVDASSTDHYIDNRENERRLEAMINSMPARRKEVFRMVRMAGHSYTETARQLNISVSTVEKHMHEAYKYLSGELSATVFIAWMVAQHMP